MLAALAFTAGAGLAVRRSRIGTYISTIERLLKPGGEIFDAGNAGAWHARRAEAIIAASAQLGGNWTGRWGNGDAYTTLCDLCTFSHESDHLFPAFRSALAGIRQSLKCTRFGHTRDYV
jgi:hypothetical protein